MKKNTLTIDIQKPIDVVFGFTVNPANTPKWIPSVLEENVSKLAPGVGTIYRQKLAGGGNSALVVTGFIKNQKLDFHLVNGKYTCSYLYNEIAGGTRLIYSEDNGIDGKLETPMTMKNLKKLKKLIEDV